MSKWLALFLTLTDIGFLLYWVLAALSQAGLLSIPPDMMYANYQQRDVIAWNWSFLPMDLAFSFFGLSAVAASARGDRAWRAYALISLTLTMAAGLMAVSYWTILLEFNAAWYLTNMFLVVWPLCFLPRLIREIGNECGHTVETSRVPLNRRSSLSD